MMQIAHRAGSAAMTCDILAQLIELTNHLGEPARDYAILGEGNTSARIDDGSFWVTASGSSLATAGPAEFVRVDLERALAMLAWEDATDEDVRRGLTEARIDAPGDVLPSVETVVHAACLSQPGVDFVGHTHPTAINMFTCAKGFEGAIGRLFPDDIVVCGRSALVIPYIDPGLALARAIRDGLARHVETHGEQAKVIYLRNHGFIALGATGQQVEDITAMSVKSARILIGTGAVGGPEFLPDAVVQRIHTRPDEHYRQRVLGLE